MLIVIIGITPVRGFESDNAMTTLLTGTGITPVRGFESLFGGSSVVYDAQYYPREGV